MRSKNLGRPFSRRQFGAAVGATALCGALVAGCGSPVSGDDETSGGGDGDAEAVTLTFWHYLTDRDGILQELAADYEAETGVSVEVQLFPADTLAQKFQAAAQADTLPDLAATWTGIGDGLAPYAEQGILRNLDDDLADGWSDYFYETQLMAGAFLEGNDYSVDPGVYLVPLDANNMQILYRTDLFEQAGIEAPPTTMEELLAVGDQLEAAGIVPFTSGFGSWPIDSFASIYQWNVIGEEHLAATFAGEERYDSEPWIEMLRVFEQLGDSTLLADGILAADLPAAESLFVSGQAAMIFDGSWAMGVFAQADAEFTQFDVFMPPAASEEFPVRIPGGVGAQLMVVDTSENADQATEFVRWLTEPEQQARYAESSSNLPANRNVTAETEMSPVLTTFSEGMESVIPSLPNAMAPAVATTMHAGLQEILAGSATAEEVAARMQLAQESGNPQ